MAEINVPQKDGKRKRYPIRIDFTPMVDLGFLLITFFIYTTTIAKPNAIDINMPVDDGPSTVFAEERVITLIPVSGHKVAYYNGSLKTKEQIKYCDVAEVRNVLLRKKGEIAALPASFSKGRHVIQVLIKPNDNCKYRDVVSLLDEMNILAIKCYALMDVSTFEKEFLPK